MPGRRPPVALVAILLALGLFAAPAGATERTGRWIALFDEGAPAARASAALAHAGVHRAGIAAPRLRIAAVDGPPAAIRALRRQPGVARVVPEYRRDLRREPDDPGWGAMETSPRTPSGTPLQWALRRERFPEAWDVTTGASALVGVIDTGVDGAHPDLAAKVAFGMALGGARSPLSDEDGHGTHVSGLACADTDNGFGIAGAGFGCRIVIVKDPGLADADIAVGIQAATDRGVDAINMSFGGGPPSPAIDRAIDYAVAHGVVLVAAASNEPEQDQGAPASQLQPGDASNIDAGRGLVVTGVNYSDANAGTGRGPQISLAAYGFFDDSDGPPGLISTYPGQTTPREGLILNPEGTPCGCRTSLRGDDRYAYLQGTSMATPQVTAAAALIGDLNPDLSAAQKIRILKQSARRAGGWTPELGWGILDAAAAVDAARQVDLTAPSSRGRARRSARLRGRRGVIRLRIRGRDHPGAPGLVASGIDHVNVWMKRGRGRYRRVRRVTRTGVIRIRVRRAGTYSIYTRAVDDGGNREPIPPRRDAKVRVTAAG